MSRCHPAWTKLRENVCSIIAAALRSTYNMRPHLPSQVTTELPSGFEPTCMAHPDTYLNKVVVGGGDGRMLLYNFMTGRLLYEFAGLCSCAVKCIVSSPALDIVGVGDADGYAPDLQGFCSRNGLAMLHSNMTPACLW